MIQGLNTLKFLMSQQEPTQEHPVNTSPGGGVTRQGVVLTDLQSLLDCQLNFSLSRAPVVPGGWGSVWDPEPSKERVSDWGGLLL